jgi:hypothetical protein
MIPALPQTRANVSIQDVEENAYAKQERTDIIRLLSAHLADNDTTVEHSLNGSSSIVSAVSGTRGGIGSQPHSIPPATLHLTRTEQRALTRTKEKEGKAKKVETFRMAVEQAPSLSI